jgi:hypothetical protein
LLRDLAENRGRRRRSATLSFVEPPVKRDFHREPPHQSTFAGEGYAMGQAAVAAVSWI